jgi:hypothetical protein
MSVEEFACLAEHANYVHTLAVQSTAMATCFMVYQTIMKCMADSNGLVKLEEDTYSIKNYKQFMSQMVISQFFLIFRHLLVKPQSMWSKSLSNSSIQSMELMNTFQNWW